MSSPFKICGPTDCDCIYGAGTSQAAECKKQLAANPHGVSVGVDTQAITDPVNAAIQAALKAAFQPFLQDLPTIGIRVGLFMFSLMLVIIGFMIVSNPS